MSAKAAGDEPLRPGIVRRNIHGMSGAEFDQIAQQQGGAVFAMTVAHRQLIPRGPDRRCRLQLHCQSRFPNVVGVAGRRVE
jgi:hypothetical protein